MPATIEPDARLCLLRRDRSCAGEIVDHRHRRHAAVAQRLLRQHAHVVRLGLPAAGVIGVAVDHDLRRTPIGRWPPSTSTRSFWPLPETPAMPTISCACTFSVSIDRGPCGRHPPRCARPCTASLVSLDGAPWRSGFFGACGSPIIIAVRSAGPRSLHRAGARQRGRGAAP